MLDQIFKLRDVRVKEKFFIDDVYLNGWAKHCGWKAALVYFSLCRHASKSQEAYPSINLIAKEFGISESSVKRGLTILEGYKIIEVERIRNELGKFIHNTYTLLDKSVWEQTHRSDRPTVSIGPTDLIHRSHRPHKDTHIKDTHIRKKYIKKEIKKYSSLEDLTSEVVNEIADQYKLPPKFVNLQRHALINYCESKGKTYKNYKAALRSFVLKAAENRVERNSLIDRKRGVDASRI